MDILPSVSALAWFRACFAGVAVEGLFKFAVIWEVFCHFTRRRPAVASLGNSWIAGTTALLVLVATLAAARAPVSGQFPMASLSHILGEAIYILASGLWLFTFLFTAYFDLSWDRRDFGIALGSSVSACVHLATWGVAANSPFKKAYLLDFFGGGIYHICVLIMVLLPTFPRSPEHGPGQQ